MIGRNCFWLHANWELFGVLCSSQRFSVFLILQHGESSVIPIVNKLKHAARSAWASIIPFASLKRHMAMLALCSPVQI